MVISLQGMLKTYPEAESVEIKSAQPLTLEELKEKLSIPERIPVYASIEGVAMPQAHLFYDDDTVSLYPIVIGG